MGDDRFCAQCSSVLPKTATEAIIKKMKRKKGSLSHQNQQCAKRGILCTLSLSECGIHCYET